MTSPMDREYLKTRPGLLAGGWSHMLQPDQLADLDRQFYADFPVVWDRSPRTLFEHLDTDQNGSLSRPEAQSSDKVRGVWRDLDADRLSKPEFVRNCPRIAEGSDRR